MIAAIVLQPTFNQQEGFVGPENQPELPTPPFNGLSAVFGIRFGVSLAPVMNFVIVDFRIGPSENAMDFH
ncbi:MAG: hypothetical protein VW169_03655 [Rhodospirillaceae bacterium]